jgi:hypothetical protein
MLPQVGHTLSFCHGVSVPDVFLFWLIVYVVSIADLFIMILSWFMTLFTLMAVSVGEER